MGQPLVKNLFLIVVIILLTTCFLTTSIAASPVVDNVTKTYKFTYSGSNATLTGNSSVTQVLTMPSSVKYNGKTYTVTAINTNFFSQCDNPLEVSEVVLPDTLKNIAQKTFNSNVDNIRIIEISGTATNSADYFLGCSSLEKFIVNENNTNLTSIDGVLYNGTTIQRFPCAKALDNSTVYKITDGTTGILAYAFYGVKNITDVKVPATVTAIRNGAFCNSSITGVHFEITSTYDISAYSCQCDNSAGVKCADRITFCFEDEADAIPANCTAPGHTSGIRCDITGEWLTGEVIPMFDHNFNTAPTRTDPTCEEDAKYIFECTYECGTKKETIVKGTALGHRGGTATCNALAVCEICHKEYGIPAYEQHAFTSYTYNNNATCEADGTDTAVCDNGCGKTDTIKADGTALGHSYTAYSVTVNATCESNTIESALCDNNCNSVNTREIANSALGHSHSAPVKINVVAATCIKDGSYTEVVSCLNCDKTLSAVNKTITSSGHTDTDNNNICNTCGETIGSSSIAACSHMCHKPSLIGFVWNIVKFFSKLLKINAVCDCGVKHY